ncbi:glycerol-3-phosphate dehydrogenase, mitochondrial [Elysia marginata]|uniref:Glycerol-3-phosphate dehydrogenase, mitochondrial n=1 Tax=Elysia marginata TaxID=1093978 RepID=A0AAV4JXX6_9GAST|nr:glycerol-3-phosphate dehydrogenase, mitochondrial [Elysia marginata]
MKARHGRERIELTQNGPILLKRLDEKKSSTKEKWKSIPQYIGLLVDELAHAERYLRAEMGLDIKRLTEKDVPLNFNKDEINQFVRRFKSLDVENKGYISINDLRRYFKNMGERITDDQLHEILKEVDLNRNAQVDIGEFLQLMSAVEYGSIVNSRFAKALQDNEEKVRISVERSGGGV